MNRKIPTFIALYFVIRYFSVVFINIDVISTKKFRHNVKNYNLSETEYGFLKIISNLSSILRSFNLKNIFVLFHIFTNIKFLAGHLTSKRFCLWFCKKNWLFQIDDDADRVILLIFYFVKIGQFCLLRRKKAKKYIKLRQKLWKCHQTQPTRRTYRVKNFATNKFATDHKHQISNMIEITDFQSKFILFSYIA